jgi:hypothetical protein
LQNCACADVDIWSGDEKRRSSWRNGRGIGERREGGGDMGEEWEEMCEEMCEKVCEKMGEKICEKIGKKIGVRRWVRRWVRREVKTRGNRSFIEYIALGKT